jgi:hypothetical protein
VPADGMAPVTYTAVCQRAGDWWEITVPELPSGRVTQARKLADVDATVKDLVALMTGADPASIEVSTQLTTPEGDQPVTERIAL